MSDAVEELVFAIQPKRESVVWQQNQLAEARYKLSPREQKLLLYVIAMIEPEAEDFGKCKVSVKDYAELTGLKVADLYQELRDSALAIREKTLVVENVLEPGMKKPVRRHGSWFEYVDEAVGDGHITIKLSSWLRPFLIHVRREFFQYRLGYAMGLKSEYAIRLYQWLKRWQFVRRKTASIQQLRLELGATEVREILFGIEAHMHGGEMDVAPGTLDRMRRRERGRAAHGDQRVDGADAQLGRPRAIPHGARADRQCRRRRRLREVDRAPQKEFSSVEVGSGARQAHLNAGDFGDSDAAGAAPGLGPIAEGFVGAKRGAQHRRDEGQRRV